MRFEADANHFRPKYPRPYGEETENWSTTGHSSCITTHTGLLLSSDHTGTQCDACEQDSIPCHYIAAHLLSYSNSNQENDDTDHG